MTNIPFTKKSNLIIPCGRFDDTIQLRQWSETHNKIRLYSENPNKLMWFELVPISVHTQTVLYIGQFVDARDYLQGVRRHKKKKPIVLTLAEWTQIAEVADEIGVTVVCFESAFPVFEGIKYIPDSERRYNELTSKLQQVNNFRLGQTSLSRRLVCENQFRVERKIRFKSTLSDNFFSANQKAFCEVFKFKEERPHRTIFALDFNSMYPSCIQDGVVDPVNLRYWKSSKRERPSSLLPGLYDVTLSDPVSGAFTELHPFEYTRAGVSRKFKLEGHHTIRCLAFDFELRFYSRFFRKIDVREGLVAEKRIPHPLAKKARQLYSERLHFSKQNATYRSSLAKFELQILYGCTSARKYVKVPQESYTTLVNMLSEAYAINFPDSFSYEDRLHWFMSRKLARTSRHQLRILNVGDRSNVHSLAAETCARARIRMARLLLFLSKIDGLDICYANTDSVHVSVPDEIADRFQLRLSKLLSDRMGALKIQCIAKRGYWFDVGRYWLLDDNGEVIQFRNKVFNSFSGKPFKRHRRIKTLIKTPNFNYMKSVHLHLAASFEYEKRLMHSQGGCLETVDFQRYNFEEISSADVAGDTLINEMLRSKEYKLRTFDSFATA